MKAQHRAWHSQAPAVGLLYLYFFVSKVDISASLKSKIANILATGEVLESWRFIIPFCFHLRSRGLLVMEPEFPFVLTPRPFIATIPEHLRCVPCSSGAGDLLRERAAATQSPQRVAIANSGGFLTDCGLFFEVLDRAWGQGGAEGSSGKEREAAEGSWGGGRK